VTRLPNYPILEAERYAEPREPRREDLSRVVPRAAIRLDVIVLRLELGRLVAVQQVDQIHACVRARVAEPDDLREPHVNLVSPRPIQPMVGVEQRYYRGACRERARREAAE